MSEELFVSANGLRFRALADGPAGGEPILMLHGFPEGADSWAPQLAGLAELGHRAVAVDLRGFGGSDAPSAEDEYTIAHLVADVAALVPALGWPSAHLAAHDWGALLGWVFVSQHPELVRSWTPLSVGHPAAVADAARNDPDQMARSAYILLFRERGKAEAVLAADGHRRLRDIYRSGPDPDAMPSATVERFIAGFQRPGRLTAALNYYRAALPELVPAMRPVRTSTVLVWGDQDPALGRTGAEATASHVEGPYRLEVLEGAGHWLQAERPDEVVRILAAHCAATATG